VVDLNEAGLTAQERKEKVNILIITGNL